MGKTIYILKYKKANRPNAKAVGSLNTLHILIVTNST